MYFNQNISKILPLGILIMILWEVSAIASITDNFFISHPPVGTIPPRMIEFETAGGNPILAQTIVTIMVSPGTSLTFHLIQPDALGSVDLTLSFGMPSGLNYTIAGPENRTKNVFFDDTGAPNTYVVTIVHFKEPPDPGDPFGLPSGERWQLTVEGFPTHPDEIQVTVTVDNQQIDGTPVALPALSFNQFPVPDISAPAMHDFGERLIQPNLSDAGFTEIIPVDNTGTANLHIDAPIFMAVDPAFTVESSFHPDASAIIAPGASYDLEINYKPGAPGSNTMTLLLNSNDPDSPPSLMVNGIGIEVQIVLLIDVSGSMAADAAGNRPPLPGEDTRIDMAKSAARCLLDVLDAMVPEDAGEFSIVTFPNASLGGNTTLKVVDKESINATNIDDAKNIDLPPLTASGNTPMGSGLQTSLTLFPGDDNLHRRAVLLLSDGKHHPPDFTPPPTDFTTGSDFQDVAKNIFIYSIGIGTGSTADAGLDLGILQDLANDSDPAAEIADN